MHPNEDKEESSNLLKEHKEKWSREDYILITLGNLIFLGNGIQVYLPGVITQHVSCELDVNKFQESLLGCIFYLPMATAAFIAGPLGKKIGKRPMLLISFYTCCLSTVLSAAVGNYYALICSRVLIGIGVGMNYSQSAVFLSERVSNAKITKLIVVSTDMIYTFGGVWVAALAYFLLEHLGWRIFIVLTSIPTYGASILILHFVHFIETESNTSYDSEEGCQELSKMAFFKRIVIICLLFIIVSFLAMGTILFLPALLKMLNLISIRATNVSTEVSCALVTLRGKGFLLVCLVTAGGIVGKMAYYILRQYLVFPFSKMIPGVVFIVSYSMMTRQDLLVCIILGNFLIQFTYGFLFENLNQTIYEVSYFGKDKFSLAIAVVHGFELSGLVLGTWVAAFAQPIAFVIVGLCFSVMVVPLALTARLV